MSRAEAEALLEYLLASFGECPCDRDNYVPGDCAEHDTPGIRDTLSRG